VLIHFTPDLGDGVDMLLNEAVVNSSTGREPTAIAGESLWVVRHVAEILILAWEDRRKERGSYTVGMVSMKSTSGVVEIEGT
jgi:hypothetical protein